MDDEGGIGCLVALVIIGGVVWYFWDNIQSYVPTFRGNAEKYRTHSCSEAYRGALLNCRYNFDDSPRCAEVASEAQWLCLGALP